MYCYEKKKYIDIDWVSLQKSKKTKETLGVF